MTAEYIKWSKGEIEMLRALSKGTPEDRLDWLRIQSSETTALLAEIAAEIEKVTAEIVPPQKN